MDHLKWEELDKKLEKKSTEKVILTKYTSLPFLESLIYFITYWISIGYCLYKFYIKSQAWKKHLYLTPKASYFGSFQDQNDSEWTIFLPIIYECIPYTFIHLVVAQVIKCFIPQVLCLFYICVSCCVLVKIIGAIGMAVCLAVPIIMFTVLHSRSKTLLWLTWCSFLIVFNTQHFYKYLSYWLSDIQDGEYKTSVMVAWIILRSLSYCLDTCEEDPFKTKPSSDLFLTILAYCLYLPLLVTGPYMPYSDFQTGLAKPFKAWRLEKLVWFCLQCMRFFFWLCLTNVILYYFYAHALTFSPNRVKLLDSWTLGGLVHFLMIFFLLKYVVYYGLPGLLARAEEYEPPDPPKCVLILHRFSDVWRYFDHGLYRFMIKHIYIPFVDGEKSLLKQVQGSVVVFIFIYVWHGVSSSVLWWSVINFVGVTLEKMSDRISQNKSFQQFTSRWFSDRWLRRLKCVQASFFLLMGINSLFIFLSSVDNALILNEKLFLSEPVPLLVSLLLLYCNAQISFDLQNYKMQKKIYKNLKFK